MATALQCPECGHRHKLADLPDTALFRCHKCERVLKVPESLRSPLGAPTTVSPGVAARSAVDSDATVISPPRRNPPANGSGSTSPSQLTTPPPAAPRPSTTSVPRMRAPLSGSLALPPIVRVVAWLVALPVGFMIAALFLKVVGVLNFDSAANVFIGTGAGRFGAVIALVPLWAVASGAIAHLALEGVARVWPAQSGGGANQPPDRP